MIRSHVFHASREAYDSSQCSDAIRDGDVLIVPSENRAAVLVEAWPVLVGTGDPGEAFHTFNPDATFRTTHDGKYLNAAIVAITLLTVETMKGAGLGTSEALLDIARSHGWAGEIPEQERWNVG